MFTCLGAFSVPSFIKNNCDDYSVLGWKCFSFSTLNISSYSSLAYNVSAKKLARSLIDSSLYVICFFSLSTFSVFFCLWILTVLLCLGVVLFRLNIIGDLWHGCTWIFIYFPRFWKPFAIISLSKLSTVMSLSFLNCYNPRVFSLMLFYKSHKISSFFFLLWMYIF